ncbi:MAG: helix-hairpin-helix domain-containing protein [Syntrophomonas sp.]
MTSMEGIKTGVSNACNEVLNKMFDFDNIDRRYILAGIVIILILVFAAGIKYSNVRNARQLEEQKQLDELVKKDQSKTESQTEKDIQVYVTGEVKNPRVCKLKSGARVIDAVEQVELLPEADIKNINMARVLQDGEAVVIPAVGQSMTATNSSGGLTNNAQLSSSPAGSSSGMVNINSAAVNELDERLPGIGPTLAQRIVDYRTSNGPFASVDDIKNVSGIGEGRFAEIKDIITIR